jgi:hypothetical protein
VLTKGIVIKILTEEESSARFERFCVELFSRLDATEYVTTSPSYDLGRDGRQTSLFAVDVFPFICASPETSGIYYLSTENFEKGLEKPR